MSHNLLFDPLALEELLPFSTEEIEVFRQWLASVPFQFSPLVQPVKGWHCDSKGDVRSFLEPAIILTCWPIILSMVPENPNDHTFHDLALRMERNETMNYSSKPDISLLRLTSGQEDLALKTLSIVEFKALV